MKIYSFAVCGVLCALSSISHGRRRNGQFDRKLKSLDCPSGTQPVNVIQLSLEGWLTKTECINRSPNYSQQKSVPREKQQTTQAPNKVTEHNYETVPKECPAAHQLVNMSSFCPSDAKVAPSCPLSNKMACVPQPFGNQPGGRKWHHHEWETSQSLKTETNLNFEMAHKPCISEQISTKISRWCRTDAQDYINCKHTEVWCVQEPSTTASKTVEELAREILHMNCPPNHEPTLIRGMCPIGSKSSTVCEESRKACRPVAADEGQMFAKLTSSIRNHHGHKGKGSRRRPGWREWHGCD